MDPAALAAQLRCPSGDAGLEVGRRMADSNKEPNLWTLDLLDIGESEDVLEVGFGPGATLAEAAKRTAGHLTGVDLSPAMLAMASERNAAVIAEGRMTLQLGDVAKLPFDDDTFDKAYAVNVLYFWNDPLQCLRELHRVLKDDGFLAITFLKAESWMPGFKESGMFRPFTAEEVEALLQEAGFTGIGMHEKKVTYGDCILALAIK